MSEYRLVYQESIPKDLEELLFVGLNTNAFAKKAMSAVRTVAIFHKNTEGKLLGGLTGFSLFGCLHVDLLWVDDSMRGRGLGTQLMQAAEKAAKDRSCTFTTVNTMDWEALPFYQKLGYEIEFVRTGFEKQSTMYFLRKSL